MDQGWALPPSVPQKTKSSLSMETIFNISPDGKSLAYGNNQCVLITEISTGKTRQVSPDLGKAMSGLRAVNWSNDGSKLVYNRKVVEADSSFYQVFTRNEANYTPLGILNG